MGGEGAARRSGGEGGWDGSGVGVQGVVRGFSVEWGARVGGWEWGTMRRWRRRGFGGGGERPSSLVRSGGGSRVGSGMMRRRRPRRNRQFLLLLLLRLPLPIRRSPMPALRLAILPTRIIPLLLLTLLRYLIHTTRHPRRREARNHPLPLPRLSAWFAPDGGINGRTVGRGGGGGGGEEGETSVVWDDATGREIVGREG